MLTEREYDTLAEVEVPEIQRSNLASVILNLVNLGVADVCSFQWIDKPEVQAITRAVDELKSLAAVTGE